MGEKKIFSIDLDVKKLVKEYYMSEQTDKCTHEIIMSVDNKMELSYGLLLNICRDAKGLPRAYFSIIQASCNSIDFKKTNCIEAIEYSDVVELVRFGYKTIELKFLKMYVSNILTMHFDDNSIRNEILKLNSNI